MRWFESERSTSLRRVSEAAMAITLAGGVGLVGLGWMPEAWLGWLLVGQCIIAAWWILAGLVGQGLEHFHEPRRLTIGWGRWRLVAWGQLRLSDELFWVLALTIALGLGSAGGKSSAGDISTGRRACCC
jgi:hypothetical protein